ncbi:response regulator transcription factor [Streptosporangiaceae bacterium NEAU-GS5]|nr:response regulator transcription factor [Streptosporangiaceae bacterium NEAU-GS5]
MPVESGGTCKRIVIVDDDDISRLGMAAILAATPGVSVVGSLHHTEAMRWESRWDEADLALVDAADDRCGDDHFPGVAVVDLIRRLRGQKEPTVMVLTGHFFDGAVRRRMREAGADYFYHRGELADAAALRAAVLDPDGRPVPDTEDPCEEIKHGVCRHSRVNAAVAYALAEGLPERLADRRDPRSRTWERLRRDFNRQARLTPMTGDGRVPDREQALPSLPQITRFLVWATRVKNRPAPPQR